MGVSGVNSGYPSRPPPPLWGLSGWFLPKTHWGFLTLDEIMILHRVKLILPPLEAGYANRAKWGGRYVALCHVCGSARFSSNNLCKEISASNQRKSSWAKAYPPPPALPRPRSATPSWGTAAVGARGGGRANDNPLVWGKNHQFFGLNFFILTRKRVSCIPTP